MAPWRSAREKIRRTLGVLVGLLALAGWMLEAGEGKKEGRVYKLRIHHAAPGKLKELSDYSSLK